MENNGKDPKVINIQSPLDEKDTAEWPALYTRLTRLIKAIEGALAILFLILGVNNLEKNMNE